MSVVLGLDPGTATTGYGFIKKTESDSLNYHESGVIRTPANMDYGDRLDTIYGSVVSLVEKFSPRVAVVEELFFSRNIKTALSVGQARGVILLSLNHLQEELKQPLELVEMNPSTAKKTLTGNGAASKKTMQRAVTQELGLSGVPEPDDAADALALGMAYCIRNRFQANLNEQ